MSSYIAVSIDFISSSCLALSYPINNIKAKIRIFMLFITQTRRNNLTDFDVFGIYTDRLDIGYFLSPYHAKKVVGRC